MTNSAAYQVVEIRQKYRLVREALVYMHQHLPTWLQKAAWQYQREDWAMRPGARTPEEVDYDLAIVLRTLRPNISEGGCINSVSKWDSAKREQFQRMIALKGNESTPDGKVRRSNPADWTFRATEQTLDQVVEECATAEGDW